MLFGSVPRYDSSQRWELAPLLCTLGVGERAERCALETARARRKQRARDQGLVLAVPLTHRVTLGTSLGPAFVKLGANS